MNYHVEVVWNREFDFCRFGQPCTTIASAIEAAKSVQNSGDGARVKKARVVDDNDKVVWAYGKMVK